MQHKNHQKIWIRLTMAAFAAVMVMSLMPLTASARETGHTVLVEDYYGLTDGTAAQMPGLVYYCYCHGDKMVPHYTTKQDEFAREIPGLIERNGNSIKYIDTYYCHACYEYWVICLQADIVDAASVGQSVELEHPMNVDGYIEFLHDGDGAPKHGEESLYSSQKKTDDTENLPARSKSANGDFTVVSPPINVNDSEGNLSSNSGKNLPKPNSKQPNNDDPVGNWDKTGAFAFYNFFYTGMRTIVNKPASANDPAWDTVKDATRIYFMQRQADNQIPACRISRGSKWYSFDYSKIADWQVTDLMVEYSTGELCGFATYTGTQTEVAVPEKINIPVYGDVKIVGLDLENHYLQKIYVNDNVTCIRRLSSVNLEEISGCKNLEYIEKYAFQNDVSLKTIPEMPKLDWIAMGAFEGCISLRDIKLPDNMTFIDFTAFGWYDTVLGNYDIGMTDQSWEDFQYLSDLSDNDKILGITLYAKKGSTTYKLLDTLINKNDALTPELDSNGKPSFKSYGESVYLMSGDEVKYFTSHWSLKSSNEYKGNLTSIGDSTGGRLGEYGDGEASWSPKNIVKNGAVTGGLLLMLTTTAGIAGYDASKKRKKRKEYNVESSKNGWGNRLTYEEDVNNNKLIFDFLGLVGDQIENMGKIGKAGKELIDTADRIQKFIDTYAQTGSITEAFAKFRLGEETSGWLTEIVTGLITDGTPWDAATGIFLGNSPIGDAVNIGSNVEHGVDFVVDMCRALAGETQKNPIAPKGTTYPGVFGVDEFCKNITDGAYGENLKNIGLTGDLLFTKGSIGQTWDGIFGEEGMGFWNFAYDTFEALGDKASENNVVLGGLKALFSKSVENFYTKR